MALLATILALSVPALSRSMRARALGQDALRFLALTEYARDEAESQGVPMSVWINPAAGRFGAQSNITYGGTQVRDKDYALDGDVHFDATNAAADHGVVTAATFAPDGNMDPASLASVRLVGRDNSVITVRRTADQWGYEIVKGAQ